MKDLNRKFDFFIGLDQTGAVLGDGSRAKLLPCAFVDARGKRPRLTASLPAKSRGGKSSQPLKLPSFSEEALVTTLHLAGIEPIRGKKSILHSSTTAILADAVFGLPAGAWPAAPAGAQTLRGLFAKAARDSATRKGYGLKPAAAFFSEILRDSVQASPAVAQGAGPYPVRDCEILAKANSVFRTHPFQKNIQCGTYRFWRDLGTYGSEWIHLRYFEDANEFRHDRPLLFEAYPSLIWREALKLQTRDRTQLREALKLFGDVDISASAVDLMVEDPDHADACILALGGYWLAHQDKLVDGCASKDQKLAREGWIVGLKREQAFRC